jgi:hypothetical protein
MSYLLVEQIHFNEILVAIQNFANNIPKPIEEWYELVYGRKSSGLDRSEKYSVLFRRESFMRPIFTMYIRLATFENVLSQIDTLLNQINRFIRFSIHYEIKDDSIGHEFREILAGLVSAQDNLCGIIRDDAVIIAAGWTGFLNSWLPKMEQHMTRLMSANLIQRQVDTTAFDILEASRTPENMQSIKLNVVLKLKYIKANQKDIQKGQLKGFTNLIFSNVVNFFGISKR